MEVIYGDIFDLVKTLSENDREKLKDMISNTITQQNDLIHYVTEKRFSSGAFCPHCKSNHIKRNGHKNNVQRYLCLDCKKTFNKILLFLLQKKIYQFGINILIA